MMVLAGEHIWGLENGRMRDMGLLKDLAAKAPKTP